MSAKEMFEALGFLINSNDKDVMSYVSNKIYNPAHKVAVVFYNDLKSVSVHCGYGKANLINVNLLKAINQQCKELGWLDE